MAAMASTHHPSQTCHRCQARKEARKEAKANAAGAGELNFVEKNEANWTDEEQR